jgi:hypothetical protein
MSLLTKSVLILLALIISFASGRYLTPTKIQEKIVIQEVVKESSKSELEHTTREIKKPDGTIIREVILSDKKETAKEQSRSELKEKLVLTDKPNYRIGIIPKYSLETKEINYPVTIEKRIYGPVFIGVYINPNLKEFGIPISVEF